ncbi:MAG: hypothetical protein Q4G35_06925 [Propionibacteriaceae bacterium]|nr:hypothetical protein [Propionibacteriaceae bacterium]
MKLTDALHGSLPEQPRTVGWGHAARRRVARRRAAVGAVAGVAVLALAIPFGLNLGRSQPIYASPEPTVEQSTDSETTPPAVDDAVSPCGADVRGRMAEAVDGKIPGGASRIWVCDAELGSDEAHGDLLGAGEPLIAGVEQAVDAFNALNFIPGAMVDCLGDGSSYYVVFEYPAGDERVVHGYNTPGGCDHFEWPQGGVVDGGAQTYLDLLRNLWADQEASEPASEASAPATSAPVSPAPETSNPVLPECAATSLGEELPSLDFVVPVGRACNIDGPTQGGVELSAELAQAVVDGVRNERQDLFIQPGVGGPASIVLASTEGEPLRLFLGSDGVVRFYHAGSGGLSIWEPTPGLMSQLWAAVGGTCEATRAFDPGAVQVDLYSAGASPEELSYVRDWLDAEGFTVRVDGETVQPMLPGIYVRFAPSNERAGSIVAQIVGGGGELSRTDDVVDVVVTADFVPGSDEYPVKRLSEVNLGPKLVCTVEN